jgi:hypothetical protein
LWQECGLFRGHSPAAGQAIQPTTTIVSSLLALVPAGIRRQLEKLADAPGKWGKFARSIRDERADPDQGVRTAA